MSRALFPRWLAIASSCRKLYLPPSVVALGGSDSGDHSAGEVRHRGRVAMMVESLATALNAAFPKGARPLWMTEPTDDHLRKAGAYDPASNMGKPEETDCGNYAGSVIVLAMLKPDMWKRDGEAQTRLEVFNNGWYNADVLTDRATTPPKSGTGIDNRRTNFIEAICNHCQNKPEMQPLRDLTIRTWYLARLAYGCSPDIQKQWEDLWNPYDAVDLLLNCKDEELPSGEIIEAELFAFETALCNLKPPARQNLRDVVLTAEWLDRSTLKEKLGFTGARTGSTIRMLEDAFSRCFNEGKTDHNGDLRFLFFKSWRQR